MIIKDRSAKPFGDVFAVNEVADFDPRDPVFAQWIALRLQYRIAGYTTGLERSGG